MCPFTIEELLARGSDRRPLATLKYLQEKAEWGLGSSDLTIYEALQKATSKIRFSKFVTGRFAHPLTDDVSAPEAHRQIRYKINKHLFRKTPSHLKYFFILERDSLLHHGMSAYHFHFLISQPAHSPGQFDRLPRIIRLNYDIKDRLIKEEVFPELSFELPPSEHRTETITDPFEILIYKKTKRTRLENVPNLNHVGSVKVEDIYDQECLTDYVLKKIAKPGLDLIVDYDNSSIDFRGVK